MKQWFKASFFLLLIVSTSFSQEKLTLEQALAIALKKNFDIQIAKNNLKSAENNVIIKRADFIPKITGSTNGEYTKGNSSQYLGDFERVTVEDTTYYGVTLGINLTVRNIYDAIKDYKRTLVSSEQSKNSFNNNVQNTLMDVTRNFYDLLKQKNLMKVREQSVETNEKQVERAQSKYDIGSVAKKDVFTAKVQLNNAKTQLLNQKLIVQRAKNKLNISLGNNAFEEIDVFDNVSLKNDSYTYEDLEKKLLLYNPELKIEKNKIENAEISYDRWFANMFYPTVGINIGYNKSVSRQGGLSDAFTRATDLEKNYGFNARLTVSYSFFNGFSDQANLENAEIEKYSAELTNQKKLQGLKAELYQAFITVNNRKEMLELQKENLVASKEEFRLAQERFNIGSGTSLDLKTAQDGVVSAESDLISAKFDAKIAEVDIDRLLGLIKTK